LRCVEEGRLSLDDRIGQFRADSPDAAATIRELLTHTSGDPSDPAFDYRPERLEPLAPAVRACTGSSYRETLANLISQLAMNDSVPGADAITLVPPAEGVPTAAEIEKYTQVLARLSLSYVVNLASAPASVAPVSRLTPGGGLISSVLDFARFDLALKQGVLLHSDTLVSAWQPPFNAAGRPLPHGLGWFVQSYAGEPVVWQFGVSDTGSSSLAITLPQRALTLILLANSNGLVQPFRLAEGDLTVSPFARLFLGLFVR
jgi:CubicO group peptidase (beta-lactamase class C family)